MLLLRCPKYSTLLALYAVLSMQYAVVSGRDSTQYSSENLDFRMAHWTVCTELGYPPGTVLFSGELVFPLLGLQ